MIPTKVGAVGAHFFVLGKEAMENQEAILEKVKELVTPLLRSRKTELVELTCRQKGNGLVLRFLVDTAQGITIDELSALSQGIGAILDEHDVIPQRYFLEINSPGLDRPLKDWRDFERVFGRRVKVETLVPVNYRRQFLGKLLGANEETILLQLDTEEKVQIRLSEIVHAQQEISF